MNQVRCANNHFYDADQYSQCPHCGDVTQVPDKTVSLSYGNSGGLDSGDKTFTLPLADAMGEDESKTVAMYPPVGGAEGPVVGWLVCTKGGHEGEAFPLWHGKNAVGRQGSSSESQLSVNLSKDKTVSRGRQAIVIYEPNRNVFMAQSGDSQQLLYVNGQIVLMPLEIVKNDRLQLGEAELMLIPCCDAAFTWPCFAK